MQQGHSITADHVKLGDTIVTGTGAPRRVLEIRTETVRRPQQRHHRETQQLTQVTLVLDDGSEYSCLERESVYVVQSADARSAARPWVSPRFKRGQRS